LLSCSLSVVVYCFNYCIIISIILLFGCLLRLPHTSSFVLVWVYCRIHIIHNYNFCQCVSLKVIKIKIRYRFYEKRIFSNVNFYQRESGARSNHKNMIIFFSSILYNIFAHRLLICSWDWIVETIETNISIEDNLLSSFIDTVVINFRCNIFILYAYLLIKI
jgi:hypothetical protein